jgi:hypothetical protein
MITNRRTFVESRTTTPDEAGWRFVTPGESRDGVDSDSDRTPVRRVPSLSWRLRH